MQKVLVGLGKYVAEHWDQPDEGLWEPRTGRRNHTHSRLLCWATLDRLISLCEQGKLASAPLDKLKPKCDAVRRQIESRGWNETLQSYVSELDGNQLDSSLLLLSWYGFEKPESPRMRSTYRAIRKRLGTPEGLLYRSESLPPEGTFAICSFWEAEYLALGGGSIEQTRDLMGAAMDLWARYGFRRAAEKQKEKKVVGLVLGYKQATPSGVGDLPGARPVNSA